MAEFWKSAERYWCKHCKVYVRDNAFERSQHEATGKHQGALKRFLRDIHRRQEQGEREDDRAKNEIERLKGLVSGSGGDTVKKHTAAAAAAPAPVTVTPASAATLAERKSQMVQLAEMGVAIPDEFRKEMAMVGDWTVVSGTVEDEEAKRNAAEAARLNVGVRKRKVPEGEEEEEVVVKKGWGSKFKRLPGDEDEQDLDSLLAMTSSLAKTKKKKTEREDQAKPEVKEENENSVHVKKESPESDGQDGAKEEKSEKLSISDIPEEPKTETKTENSPPEEVPTVVFKKRKAKQIRR
ncbi:hypothetical protein KEM56_003171 [Ascosphaera pollenicola]|nr:hypothetical protein KEM56_003171 [Ascosphaera pollenicola]